MIVLITKYKVPLETVLKDIELHRSFLTDMAKRGFFISAGPQEPYTGGVAIVRNASRQELAELVKEDPYYQRGYYDYELVEFDPKFFLPVEL